MKTQIKLCSDITIAIHGIVLAVCLLMMNPASAQTAAGKVVFAQGQPQAVNTQGTSRPLARGNEVFSGDRLITDSGRLQISMADGAFISVQPDSEYQIENYNYSGSPDGTEQANYRLDKGGVRAITGLIGRQNPEAYKVNTAVATIGIRGTGHNTRICQGDCSNREDGLYHFTWEGITYVVNDADLQDVPAGNGVYVEDIDSPILLLDQPPALVAI
ncbi:MAG: FecR family protein, partial [Gammaproteobacteria bacterium]